MQDVLCRHLVSQLDRSLEEQRLKPKLCVDPLGQAALEELLLLSLPTSKRSHKPGRTPLCHRLNLTETRRGAQTRQVKVRNQFSLRLQPAAPSNS